MTRRKPTPESLLSFVDLTEGGDAMPESPPVRSEPKKRPAEEGIAKRVLSRGDCRTCKFWDSVRDEVGRCRVAPPVIIRNAGQGDGVWPVTQMHDWCGSYARSEQ